MNLNTNEFINPKMAARHNSKFEITEEKYTGIVWCPTTRNGNWLARRNGTVYYTGNCFDWGFVNPLAFIEFQVDSYQRVRVWREHYLERVTLTDHLELLKHRANPPGYKLDLCFGDAADPGSIETVNAYFSPCWGDPKSKDIWMEGVQLVKSFLKPQQVGNDASGRPIEEPWLTVDHACRNTIREFNNYRAHQTKRKQDVNAREAAQSYDDHALDALRYGMMHIFKLGANIRLSSTVKQDELVHTGTDAGFFTSGIRFE